ncbi:GspH/FimT family pseudopilin [Propionivibrio sp.]|uniref:GspH/FimT family pseudopilin n=1 Tax=Propionivibrio sp. TaxID=2212460 RepID=UPI00272DEF51|nr:GspH/FimT family pseudopilin [Propionivibrio sp.]
MRTDHRIPYAKAMQGFSLVELMVVVAVLAILASLAVPSFQELIAAQRVRAAASALYESLLLARSEAIKRNSSVTLSPNSSDLSNGWSVLLADGTTSVRTQESLGSVTFSPASPALGYTALGRLSGSTQIITVAAEGTLKQRKVRAEASGRICVAEGDGSC